jgi:hypothetical protein
MFGLHQDPFDGIDQKYCQELNDELQGAVKQSLLSINLDIFMSSLHECILLELTAHDASDADYQDNAGYELVSHLNIYSFIHHKMVETAVCLRSC